jgi:16S rRNA (cytosine967-C5)-methyltransferase
VRARALSILERVESGEAFAEHLLRREDPPFVRELVYGVLRRQLTLDAIHDAYGKRPAAKLDAPIRAAVRVGLYQLLFLDGIPKHAAVSEAVGALKLHSHRAYANGVLRRITRECNIVAPDLDRGGASPTKRFERPGRLVAFFTRPVFPDPERGRAAWLAAYYSHPEFLVQRWVERVGEEQAVAWMEEGNRVPALYLRPHAGRVDAAGLVERLAGEGLTAGVIEREQGFDAVQVVGKTRALMTGRSFRDGLFSVQDVRQMDAVEILAPIAGETIWDTCAAPGGKTAHIAELLGDDGRVVATDRYVARLERVRETVDRLGLEGVDVAEYDVFSDAAPPGKPAAGFDAILLDAPCSNTAVLGPRPEARWRLKPGTFDEMAAIQTRMIEAVRKHLAPGGRLVFSSCSREPEEGEHHALTPTRSPFVWFAKAPA